MKIRWSCSENTGSPDWASVIDLFSCHSVWTGSSYQNSTDAKNNILVPDFLPEQKIAKFKI